MINVKLLFQFVAIVLCQVPQPMNNQPNYEAMKTNVTTKWSDLVKQVFFQGARLNAVYYNVPRPDQKVTSIVVPKCVNTTFDPPFISNSTDFVAFIQFVHEETEEYVTYSDLCDRSLSAVGRPLSGVIVFNTYMLDKYFDYNTSFDNIQISKLIAREIVNLQIFSYWQLTSNFTDPDSTVYPATGIKLLNTSRIGEDFKNRMGCKLDEFPVVMNKRGFGFRIPNYIAPQDIMGELVGHEGVILRFSYLSNILMSTNVWYGNYPSSNDIVNFQRLISCDFFQKGCKASLNQNQLRNLYCDPAETVCSIDNGGVGNCTPIARLPECHQALPVMANDRPVLCNQVNQTCVMAFPGNQTTPDTKCYNVTGDFNTYLDNGQVCRFNTYINAKAGCKTFQSSIHYTDNQLYYSYSLNFLNCSNRGIPIFTDCFCQNGYAGRKCEIECFDEKCNSCTDAWTSSSTPQCYSCLYGYSLIQGKFCQLSGSFTKPVNCNQSLTPSADSCLQCLTGYLLVGGPKSSLVGACGVQISNCQNQTNYKLPNTCDACNEGYTKQYLNDSGADHCFENITDCLVYEQVAYIDSCQQCASGLELTAQYPKSCVKPITNCVEYATGGDCSLCITNFSTIGQACVKTIVHCQVYFESGLCKFCEIGFTMSSDNLTCNCLSDSHFFDNNTKCYPNIDNCSEYQPKFGYKCQTCVAKYDLLISKNNYCLPVIDNCKQRNASNTSMCQICNETYYPSLITPKCFKGILNCTTESEGSCSVCNNPLVLTNDNQSCVCESGKHLSVDKTMCFDDIEKCLLYDTIDGYNCIKCEQNYLLYGDRLIYCIAVIDKCATRIPQTPNLCDTCLTGFHPAPGNATCNPNIIGCIVFNGSMCAECDSTYWILQDQDCFWNITGCISQQHQTCSKCGDTYIQTQIGSSNVTCVPCPEKNLAIANKCFPIIEGCVTYAHKNNTCLVCDQGMFLDFQNNKCLPPISGCLVRKPTKLDQCIACKDSFQIINGQCSSCTIGGCTGCVQDQNTLETICESCLNPFILGTSNKSCETNCGIQYGQTNCTNCLSVTKCNACTSDSYLDGGICQSCEQTFAYCTECTQSGCSQCKDGSYLNINTKYCQPCTIFDSNCLFCNSKQCIQCQTGFMLFDGFCASCDSQVKGSLECARPNSMKVGYSCLDGFFFTGDFEAPCTSCSELSQNCQICSSSACTSCKTGFFLKDSKCTKCQETCATCNNTQVCLTCPSGSVLNSQQLCSTSIAGFSLKNTPPLEQAQTYVQKKQAILTKQAPYPVTGNLDQNLYFCVNDEQCNKNGRCQITNCLCLDTYFGSRCQYSVNSTSIILSHQSDVLTYLTKLPMISSVDDYSNRVQMLNTIADTSYYMQPSSIDQVYYLLKNYLNFSSMTQNKTILTTLLTCIGQYVEGFIENINCPLQTLSSLEQMQNTLMNQLSITQIYTPHIRQLNSQYDLRDPAQAKSFKSNFKVQRLLQDDSCDDSKRIIAPSLTIGQDTYQRILDAQTNPYDKINFLQAHIYQKTHIDSHSNTSLYAATTRVDFSILGQPIKISNVEPIQIIIPKVDQRDSIIDKDYQCVSWNDQTESWNDNGILANLTQHCENYIVCYSTHLSDFTVVYNPQVQNGNPAFDSQAVQTNAAWWLSLSWFILFVLLSIYNYGKYTFIKKTYQGREVLPAFETEKADNQGLVQNNPEQQNELQTPRQTIKIQAIGEWMAFPLYSILCSDQDSSASIQIQKVCLLTIQLQMFTFITAGFITIDPFMKEVFVVYYFATIVMTWISNYLFGIIAVNTRSTNQVSPAFFLIWFFVFFGLSVVGIYFLWDLDGSHDGYLLLGVFVEVVGDCFIFDFLIAVLCNNALKQSNKGGILDLVRMRGYL